MTFELQRHKQWLSTLLKLSSTMIVLMLAFAHIANGQNSIERTISCQCINNSAPEGFAQFLEEITVYSGSEESWYIASVSGLYTTGSPVPPIPQTPFAIGPNGFQLEEVQDGQYVIQGISLESLGYSIFLTNGPDTLSLQNILCDYPSATIEGDNSICEGETLTYTNVEFSNEYTYQWSIGGKGVIVGSTTGESLVVNWNDNATGTTAIFLNYSDDSGCGGSVNYTIYFEAAINLACNNLNNYTINPDCTIEIMADDVLEDMQYNNDSYIVTMKLLSTGEIIPQGSKAGNYLNQNVEVSVFHICGDNSCWGLAYLEDKYIPPLSCANDTILCTDDSSPLSLGFPLPDTVEIYQTGPYAFEVYDFDGCGTVFLSYADTEVINDCATDFYSVTTRKWTAVDESGNTTFCTELIYFKRTTVDDVVFPGNWDGITNPVLECDGNYPVLPSGFPDPIYTGFPTEGVCPHLTVTYVDLETIVCGATYKVVRKWKVFDPCENETITHNQIIKVADNDAPEFYCPPDLTFGIEDGTCEYDLVLNMPANVYDCSDVQFIAQYYKLDKTGNIDSPTYTLEPINGKFYFNNLIVSDYRVFFIAEDACGQKSTCNFKVTIQDWTPPTAICDSSSAISLDLDGYAVVPASTFDGGSYDNCSDVTIEIKRMNSLCGPNYWGTQVTLCCADVQGGTMLQLRVTDASGNSNTCMFEVKVQDKKPPVITCPSDLSLDCTEDQVNLDQYGVPYVTDNCEVVITEEVINDVNFCGTGVIKRIFTATDPSGNASSCTQRLFFYNLHPLFENEINWPLDYTVNDCNNPALLPGTLPAPYGFPTFPDKACSEIGVNYTDKVYTNYNGTCKTIFRTWTLIDQCSINYFTHIQKLYVNDSVKPEFLECSDKIISVQALPNCEYFLDYKKEAFDNCTPEENLIYSYDIDLYNNGFIEIWEPGNHIQMNIPAGQHQIFWRVEDECGNFKVCIEIITVLDSKKPTPYCLGGLSTVVMESTGSVEIWASDFNLNSTDNCTTPANLVFSFSEDLNDKSRVFTCDDLEGAAEKIFEIEIFVFDEYGNFDSCTSMIRITSNGHCMGSGTVNFDIGGTIKTEDDEIMSDVELTIKDMYSNLTEQIFSNEYGYYAFPELTAMVPYEISANYEDSYLNGVSTLDIILIQKHILGLEILDSPYKLIAADVNRSENITGTDIIQLRKLLLGFYDELPSNTSWRFVDGHAIYTDPTSPWPVQDKIIANPLMGDMMDRNMVSVKVGDVNNSRTMGFWTEEVETRSLEELILYYQVVKEGDKTKVVFSTKEILTLQGVQFEIQSNLFGEDVYVESKGIALDPSHYRIEKSSEHFVFSWSKNQAQLIENEWFSLETESPIEGALNLYLDGLRAEAYVDNEGILEVQSIRLQKTSDIKHKPEVATSIELWQNEPNPFSRETNIRFSTPIPDNISLEVRNLNGTILYRTKRAFDAGEHMFKVTDEQLGYSGMMIYTVSGSTGSRSGKMMAIR